MLKNIPKIISPELLKILCEMGHGDELMESEIALGLDDMAKLLSD